MKRRVGAAIVLLSLVLVGCGPAVPVSTEIKQEVEENDTMNININGQVGFGSVGRQYDNKSNPCEHAIYNSDGRFTPE